MNDAKKEIFKKLSTNQELLNLLPTNRPFSNSEGTLAKKNSIIPITASFEKMKTPFVSIQAGSEDKIGLKLIQESFYIRVYNSPDKSFEEIRKILQKIKEILDESQLELVEGINVMVKYEGSLSEMFDEPYNLNFRESRYQVSSL